MEETIFLRLSVGFVDKLDPRHVLHAHGGVVLSLSHAVHVLVVLLGTEAGLAVLIHLVPGIQHSP